MTKRISSKKRWTPFLINLNRLIQRQNKQVSAHSWGISFWQRGHINPFSLIARHVWQKSAKIPALLFGSFMREITIWSIRAKISVEPSIANRFPLSLLRYLLMADCDSPKSFAVSCSLNPCFSTICLAITAFTAGKTVFTPTSHGSIKFYTNYSYFRGKVI